MNLLSLLSTGKCSESLSDLKPESNISGNPQLEENATSDWDITSPKWAKFQHKSIQICDLQQQNVTNLNHFTYLCLHWICIIVAWYKQQQAKPRCTSCMFKSNQLTQKIHLNLRKRSLPSHNNLCNSMLESGLTFKHCNVMSDIYRQRTAIKHIQSTGEWWKQMHKIQAPLSLRLCALRDWISFQWTGGDPWISPSQKFTCTFMFHCLIDQANQIHCHCPVKTQWHWLGLWWRRWCQTKEASLSRLAGILNLHPNKSHLFMCIKHPFAVIYAKKRYICDPRTG